MGKSDVWNTPTSKASSERAGIIQGKLEVGRPGSSRMDTAWQAKEALLAACASNFLCKDIRWVVSSLPGPSQSKAEDAVEASAPSFHDIQSSS